MNTGVIKLDPLADTIRPAAQDQDLLIRRNRYLILAFAIGRIIIGGILNTAHRHGFIAHINPGIKSFLSDFLFCYAEKPRYIAVGKPQFFGPGKFFFSELRPSGGQQLFLKIN